MGMMSRKPRASASRAIRVKSTKLPPLATKAMMRSTMAMPMPAFSGCWNLKVIGVPFISACSLAKAMSEPVKVTAPMARPRDISISDSVWMWCGVPMPKLCGPFSAEAATNTAARPTSEWKAATSWGSAVILMRRAAMVPMVPPMAMPRMMRKTPLPNMPPCAKVAIMAIAMPAMPIWLPRRDVVGCERPRSARMKRTAAAR